MTTSFLGIPIDGDIVRAERKVQQRPLEEFSPLLQAVLDDPQVTEFGWRQCTPYFNDGEPCVFGAHGAWVRTAGDEDADRDDLDVGVHVTLGPRLWNPGAGRYVDVERAPEKAALYGRCKELASAVEGGAFDDVLLEAFGDHADITVRRDGITVEFYEHD
jgi:hypothetical protein